MVNRMAAVYAQGQDLEIVVRSKFDHTLCFRSSCIDRLFSDMAGVVAPQVIAVQAVTRDMAHVPLPVRRKKSHLTGAVVAAKAQPVKDRRLATAVQSMDIGKFSNVDHGVSDKVRETELYVSCMALFNSVENSHTIQHFSSLCKIEANNFQWLKLCLLRHRV